MVALWWPAQRAWPPGLDRNPGPDGILRFSGACSSQELVVSYPFTKPAKRGCPLPSSNAYVCSKSPSLIAQTHLLVRTYTALLKDRALLAAEVMHEYDQKVSTSPGAWKAQPRLTLHKQFVLPRAMPAVRDASTMTNQAETIDPREWRDTIDPENWRSGARH